MTRLCPLVFAAVSFPIALFSQQTAGKQTFDIADVHVSPRADWVNNAANAFMGGYLSGNRYELRRATLVDMIRTAYNVDASRIYGGPSWIDYDRYEVVAKTKPGTSPETLRLMLQALLTDRFGLIVKPDTQTVPGYTLTRADRELRIKPSSQTGRPGCQPAIREVQGTGSIPCHAVTLQTFATTLAVVISGPGLVRPQLVDNTGLEGTWDIDIEFTPPSGGAADRRAAIAVEVSKLGLDLELGKIPQPGFAVINANEQPTPNAPELEKASFPRPAPEFEVASVRLANNEGGGSRALLFGPGGRVTAQACLRPFSFSDMMPSYITSPRG
jgi:uncharacterized protein (TIGR03435 family)